VYPVCIVMIEDDEGHARLIERNIRRAGVNNEIAPFTNGTDAVNFLFGPDGSGQVSAGQRCYDLGANVYITKPVNYEGFANAIRQLGLFFSVIQVPSTE
jgi:hypothetical protein